MNDGMDVGERSAKIEEIADLIEEMKIAMVTTVAEDGRLYSRPMVAVGLNLDGSLWFFTSAHGELKRQVDQHHDVNVSFSDIAENRYLSLSGRAYPVFDRARAYELWRPDFRAWFPQGLDDPDLVMLKVQLDQAEYWDSPTRTGVTLPGMVRAVVTGERQREPDYEKTRFPSNS